MRKLLKSILFLSILSFSTALEGISFILYSSKLKNVNPQAGLLSDPLLFQDSATYSNREIPFAGFIENQGQIGDDEVVYYLSSQSGIIYFHQGKIIFWRIGQSSTDSEDSGTLFQALTQVTLKFPGANFAIPEGRKRKEQLCNFFYGSQQWTDVTTYDEVWYGGLYPGVDLRFFMSDKGLKYEFHAEPGANTDQITVQLSGEIDLSITNYRVYATSQETGDIIYEDVDLFAFEEGGKNIAVKFVPRQNYENAYGFEVSPRSPGKVLVIDPLMLAFSTYLGGGGSDVGNKIRVDSSGCVYIAGFTSSADFPTRYPYQGDQTGTDAFIAKLNASGTGLMYSTYIGGGGADAAYALEIDSTGNVYISGYTDSSDFPTLNPYQTDQPGRDVFVTKLNATGNGLNYSTYVGGSGSDWARGIVVDTQGCAYIIGDTDSSNYPTVNPYQATPRKLFVSKLNATGNGLNFSTYFGTVTGYNDFSKGIEVDVEGFAYILGQTDSSDLPILNQYQSFGGTRDFFITKFNKTGNTLIYSTYLGGNDLDEAMDLALDETGCVYVTGRSMGSFPLFNPIQSDNNGWDAIVTKLNSAGNGVVYGTYLGGSSSDEGTGIDVDNEGNAYITGQTNSGNFPTCIPYQTDQPGYDTFITKINATGTGMNYSTYLGGSGSDDCWDIAVDIHGCAYVTGSTSSTDFPLYTPVQTDQGGSDTFVTAIALNANPTITNPWDYVVSDMGIFYSSIKFSDAEVGANPPGFILDETPPSTDCAIIANYAGHAKVLQISDNNNIELCSATHNFLEGCQESGIVEWQMAIENTGTSSMTAIFSNDEGYSGPAVKIENGRIYVWQGSLEQNIAADPIPGQFCHFRVQFNSTTDKYQVWANGTFLGTFDFANPVMNLTKITFRTDPGAFGYSGYVDSIGFSWDPCYHVGQNFPNITWTINDDSIRWSAYEIYRNGTPVAAGIRWLAGQPLTVYIYDLLFENYVNYTLVARDGLGGSISDEVLVVLNQPPHLNGPVSKDGVLGTFNALFSWSAKDNYTNNPTFHLLLNGTTWGSLSQTWIPNTDIPVSITGLTIGDYNVTCVVQDGYGLRGFASNSVLVRVVYVVTNGTWQTLLAGPYVLNCTTLQFLHAEFEIKGTTELARVRITGLSEIEDRAPLIGVIASFKLEVENPESIKVPILARFYYDPLLLSADVSEEDLTIFRWDGTNWIALEGLIQVSQHCIIVEIVSFSDFAIAPKSLENNSLIIQVLIISMIVGISSIMVIKYSTYPVVRLKRIHQAKQMHLHITRNLKTESPLKSQVDAG